MTSSHRSHRTRLARALAALAGIGYQTALSRVIAASEAGLLPKRLDESGLRAALDVLLTPVDQGRTPDFEVSQYRRLDEVLGRPLTPAVNAWVDRARAAGALAIADRGRYDPLAQYGLDESDDLAVTQPGWWSQIRDAGTRREFAMPCPYPDGSSQIVDGSLPLDMALDERDATGDIDTYELTLMSIVEHEPRDVDAHVHLGNIYLSTADRLAATTEGRRREGLTRAAADCYLAGVAVAELALPDPFLGVLEWSEIDNRPFLRALHGLALAWWELRQFDRAEATLANVLWLNPMDHQGARTLLADVRKRVVRDPTG